MNGDLDMTADEPTPAQLQAAREQLDREIGDYWRREPAKTAVRERALRLAAEERHAEQDDLRRAYAEDLMDAEAELAAMRERAEAVDRELEQERVRLAGCGVAAMSPKHCEGLKPGDYGHSASMDDVLRVVSERDTLRTEVARLTEALERERIERQAAEARVAQFEDEAWDELMGM